MCATILIQGVFLMDRGVEVDNSYYQDLANAIVERAVEDYRYVLSGYTKKENAPLKEKEIESFFLGQWFVVLTNIDGKDLLKRLRREYGK